MNKHLEQIVTLSKIDTEIDAYEPKMQSVKKILNSWVSKKEAFEKVIKVLKEEIQDEVLKQRKNELHLEELSVKLIDTAKKSKDIKTEREMKSLQLEEEIAKEQITFANEEIARHEKIIEIKTEKIKEQKELSLEFNTEVEKTTIKVEKEITTLEKDRSKIYIRKQETVANMNQKGLVFYERVRRWAKTKTVVEVKKQACYGCFMKISDKVYADLIIGEDIITCPECGRILYIEPNTEDVSE